VASTGRALLVDFGSTFTKLRLVDLESGQLVDYSQAPTTVGTNILDGLEASLQLLRPENRRIPELVRAASSAAGGLRMVAVGLVPNLTLEAARRAALGAGAKLVESYAGALTETDLNELKELHPDIILLAGGIDGGDRKVIEANASLLSSVPLGCHVVVAGNRSASDQVSRTFEARGVPFTLCDNVMPELGRLNVEPSREAIREIFMAKIVHARGLDAATELVGRVVMPTPMAVLKGAALIPTIFGETGGFGGVAVIDVGGATTDVHSIGDGSPRLPGIVIRGLPEPFAKRTVEGDLGIRINAATVLRHLEADPSLAQQFSAEERQHLASCVPVLANADGLHAVNPSDPAVDRNLAWIATRIAVRRHAGWIETVPTARGVVQVQTGKDLANFAVLGTGGVFANNDGGYILDAATSDLTRPELLLPSSPRRFIDTGYCMAAAGLLVGVSPSAAVNLLRYSVREVA
jgi:uncharacterized protein (TIGR01319 family)